MIVKTQVMPSSSARSINIRRLGHNDDDEQCPPCKCKNGICFKRTASTNDNPSRTFWNCKNLMSSEGLRCKIFKWKDKEIEEGEIVKAQKKVVQLEQARGELQDLSEVEKEALENDVMELKKKNVIVKTYLGYANCLILVLFITIIRMWLNFN
ncbi:unnamed protein product [Lactuca saligna]|uniref:GRF-type domain-containing protein n=1 Tax=Lactuca saligna TaxID=75948 RepID=A0AA36EPA5_LACSI|nr:unnamed protein product [Lactuca saligna]